MSGSTLHIDFISAIICIIFGIIVGFCEKPTIKFFLLLFFCAILYYGFGIVFRVAFEYVCRIIFANTNIVIKNNPSARWMLFFLIASITVLLRWLIRKLASERD